MTERVKENEQQRIPDRLPERPPVRKDEPSVFDKILESNRLLQKGPMKSEPVVYRSNQQETKVTRQEEHGERSRDDKSDEKERERTKEQAKSERTTEGGRGDRIIGKGKMKGSSERGSGGEGRGYGETTGRKSAVLLKKAAFDRTIQTSHAESARFAGQLKSAMESTHLSKEFVQNIVNQIVKFVGTGLNKEGEKEVRLDIHERIFRGLQLRIALKRDKVAIHFLTSNRETRELFINSKEAIAGELASKGIQVGDIKVT